MSEACANSHPTHAVYALGRVGRTEWVRSGSTDTHLDHNARGTDGQFAWCKHRLTIEFPRRKCGRRVKREFRPVGPCGEEHLRGYPHLQGPDRKGRSGNRHGSGKLHDKRRVRGGSLRSKGPSGILDREGNILQFQKCSIVPEYVGGVDMDKATEGDPIAGARALHG